MAWVRRLSSVSVVPTQKLIQANFERWVFRERERKKISGTKLRREINIVKG